jgi:hypothetical protein
MATRLASWAGQGIAFFFMLGGTWQIFGGQWLNGLWALIVVSATSSNGTRINADEGARISVNPHESVSKS